MSFIKGLYLIDCPASAVNNAGENTESNYDNAVAVKKIQTKEGKFAYISAQAIRYYIREKLKDNSNWEASPVFREKKIAYTDANPIEYAEDDLFGYMRAPSKKNVAENDLTPLEKDVTLTRNSPVKVSTVVSVGPAAIVDDFGVMARHEGDPVPFAHEFYRASMLGMMSIDLRMCGRFYHISRTGYKHLDSIRIELAKKNNLNEYDNSKAFELPVEERAQRVAMFLNAFANLSGGAKSSIHYTDIAPRFLFVAVGSGGNHFFPTIVGPDSKNRPHINLEAIKESISVFKESLQSKLYVGLTKGYLD